MDNQVWQKIDDKRGVLLALAGDKIYRIEFSGWNATRKAKEAVTALQAGEDPATITTGKSNVVPLSAIQRVEVSSGGDTVRFFTVESDKPVKVEFSVQSGDDAPIIARTVVEKAAFPHAERSEDVGVVEAVLGPVIIGLIVGLLWFVVYSTANDLESGQEVDVNHGSSRSRGIKRIASLIAQILGPTGTIVVGVILLVGIIAWAAKQVTKRPQRLVWGPPTAA